MCSATTRCQFVMPNLRTITRINTITTTSTKSNVLLFVDT